MQENMVLVKSLSTACLLLPTTLTICTHLHAATYSPALMLIIKEKYGAVKDPAGSSNVRRCYRQRGLTLGRRRDSSLSGADQMR